MEKDVRQKIEELLKEIYKEKASKEIIDKIIRLADSTVMTGKTSGQYDRWDEQDILLITYGDNIRKSAERPLQSLSHFLGDYLSEVINIVHILPFFPYSSDDGFSVIDYTRVDPHLGSWEDVEKLEKNFRLMTDLVINHISRRSRWFQNYLEDRDPGREFFIEVDPDSDLSDVVRPRSKPLLTKFEKKGKEKYLWTTFSEDQIDLDYSNPELLYEMLKVFLLYLQKGAHIIRLDAIAYLWKEIGTSCIHLQETHRVVKLMRKLMEEVKPSALLLTETNVPQKENFSYFGKSDEAHMIYQFSLPPLLLHALYTGNSTKLSKWAEKAFDAPTGCTFLNFTASHDGIGLRPLQGLVPSGELEELCEHVKNSGGLISSKKNSDGSESPYELNITYFDALKSTKQGADSYQAERFCCSQTLMMELRGMPAYYIHSLLASSNNQKGLEESGQARTINREKLEYEDVVQFLKEDNIRSKVFRNLIKGIRVRKGEALFHPDVPQRIHEADKRLFVCERYDEDKDNVIFCLSNISKEEVSADLHFVRDKNAKWIDLLTGKEINLQQGIILQAYECYWLKKLKIDKQ